MEFTKKRICLVGGTGAYLGSHVTRAAVAAGHDVTVVSRGGSSLHEEFESLGVKMVSCGSTDIDKLTEIFTGMDVVFCFPGIGSARSIQVRYLAAAKRAGVGRFIPDDFGCDTKNIPYGQIDMFDQKKDFAKVVELSGVPYTLIFNHCISEWMLPAHQNQHYYQIVGDGNVNFLTVHKRDVANLAVLIATDPRCVNQCVSLNGCGDITQREAVDKLKQFWPNTEFNFKSKSAEVVLDLAANGSDVAPPGHQSVREMEQINKLVWIDGLSVFLGPDVLKATDLYPDYNWFTIDAQLSDATFVFGAGKEPK